jgi:hypothetical protein
VAFPLRSPHVHTLCTLEPFVSQHRVLVTPVIAFLDDVSVLDELRAAPGEVARIFDHSLEALLDPELLVVAREGSEETLAPLGSDDWPYETELHVSFVHFHLSFWVPYLVRRARLTVCLKNAVFFSNEIELLGRPVVGQYVSHAPFSEHRLAGEGADGRHSGMP